MDLRFGDRGDWIDVWVKVPDEFDWKLDLEGLEVDFTSPSVRPIL